MRLLTLLLTTGFCAAFGMVSAAPETSTPPTAVYAPSFLRRAQKDPDGAKLDRVQIIKVWLAGASCKGTVFDVSLSGDRHDDAKTGNAPAVGNTGDLAKGTYVNSKGAAALSGEWRDPAFDPDVTAMHDARVLEIPTARWSTLLAIRNHLPLPARAAATIQERAWTSPIWFTPPKS